MRRFLSGVARFVLPSRGKRLLQACGGYVDGQSHLVDIELALSILREGGDDNGELLRPDDRRSESGQTALFFASLKEPTGVLVQALVAAGASPTVVAENGWTPVHAAASACPATNLRALAAGQNFGFFVAALAMPTRHGELPRELAQRGGFEETVRLLDALVAGAARGAGAAADNAETDGAAGATGNFEDASTVVGAQPDPQPDLAGTRPDPGWAIDPADVERMQFLGGGSFGQVHECRVRGRPGKYAIKSISARSEEARASLQLELDLLGRLRHENIASLVGVVRGDDRSLALVMELYSGSLNGVVRKRSKEVEMGVLEWFSGREAAGWLRQIASGLHYLHDTIVPAISHRDLKSDNCLVELRGMDSVHRVLLADFGISKALDEAGTMGHTIQGTRGYMAPDMVTGKYDPLKTDVYAFGVLALVLLSGLEPPEMQSQVGQAVVFPLSKTALARADTDESWQWIVKQIYYTCASVDPARRPTSCEILEQFEGRWPSDGEMF
jgi:Protein kinase domain